MSAQSQTQSVGEETTSGLPVTEPAARPKVEESTPETPVAPTQIEDEFDSSQKDPARLITPRMPPEQNNG